MPGWWPGATLADAADVTCTKVPGAGGLPETELGHLREPPHSLWFNTSVLYSRQPSLPPSQHGWIPMYTIRYTQLAIDDLKSFRKHEQQLILTGIHDQLSYEPTTETRNRKPLRPNPTAAWELRLREIRVFYNIDDQIQIVEIQRVGEKRRSLFFFRGRKEDL